MLRELRILVADDASVMRRLLGHWLNKMVFCQVVEAQDGLEAIRKVQEAQAAGVPFDLVLTDVKMPHVDGIRLVEYVRGKLANTQVPIVVITTFADPDLRDKALEAGANGYITKPLKYFELLRVLIRLFGSSYSEMEKPALAH
ncbi:MAG: response regulator [Bdellovibrionota bacterium]